MRSSPIQCCAEDDLAMMHLNPVQGCAQDSGFKLSPYPKAMPHLRSTLSRSCASCSLLLPK